MWVAGKLMASQPRTCATCSVPLCRQNRSGYCTRHQNANPEKRRKISESLKRAHQNNPQWRADRVRAGKASASKPGEFERRAQQCRELRLWEFGVAARTPAINAKIGETMRAVKMAWCPPHLRAEARRLSQSKKLPHAQVRSIILEQHEIEMRRWRKSVGAEPAVETNTTPSKGVLFIDRASATAADWAGVPDIWIRTREERIVRARWAVYLALRRGGWTRYRIARETGMERKGVEYALAKAEILASVPGVFSDLYRRVVAA